MCRRHLFSRELCRNIFTLRFLAALMYLWKRRKKRGGHLFRWRRIIVTISGWCQGHHRDSLHGRLHQLSAGDQQDGLVVWASCQQKVTDSIYTTACCFRDVLLSCPVAINEPGTWCSALGWFTVRHTWISISNSSMIIITINCWY